MRRAGDPTSGAGKGNGVVTVAVDSDRNSQYALRWAADHLLARGQIFYLLHIRRKMTSVPTIGEICFVFDVFHLFFGWTNISEVCPKLLYQIIKKMEGLSGKFETLFFMLGIIHFLMY